MYRKRFIITENEKKHIRNLYGLITEQGTFTGCTFSEKSNDLPDYKQILEQYNNDHNAVATAVTEMAKKFKEKVKDLQDRPACQAGLNKIRPFYRDKKFIIIDQLKNTAYFFDLNGNGVGTWVITGRDTPNEKWSEFAGLSYDERVKKVGTDLAITQPGASFTAPGRYQTDKKGEYDPHYSGKGENLFDLYKTQDGKEVTQALHGVKPTKERLDALKKVSNIPLSGEPNVNLDLSSGCINFPEEFINTHKEKFTDAYVFVIKSDQSNYYVLNPKPIIDNPGKCYSNEVLDIQIT
jgi:hypothetical protein